MTTGEFIRCPPHFRAIDKNRGLVRLWRVMWKVVGRPNLYAQPDTGARCWFLRFLIRARCRNRDGHN